MVAGTKPTPQLAAQLTALERQLYASQVAGSVGAIAPLLSADLRYVHSTGVAETRDAYLAGVQAGAYEYGSIASRDVDLDVSEDLAFQRGIVDMAVGANGAPKSSIRLLFCLVWRREGPQWRLLYRQATRMD